MAGLHVGPEQHRPVAGVEVAQARHVLGRFPVLHLRIPQPGADEHGRVGLGLQVVVGRVLHDVVVERLLLRIAPLVVLVGGQRDTRVEHGGDHVHERHLREDDVVLLRGHVGDRAHQQSTGAAAEGRHPVRRGMAFLHQVVGDIDEVGEGVELVEQLAVLVPPAAQLLAAADVGDGIDHAAVEQADIGGAETRVHRNPVAAVGVLQQRRAAVLRCVAVADQGHRDPGPAVARRRPHPLGHVLRGVVAGHRLLLELAALAGVDVQFVGGGRGGHRGVAVAQPLAVRLGVGRQAHRIGRFVGLHVFLAAVLADQAQALQRVGTLGHGQEAVEQFHVLDEHVFVVRHQVLPLRARGGVAGRLHQLEVGGAIGIGADHPAPAQVVGVVLDIALARRQHGERGRVAGRGVAVLVRYGAVQADHDVPVVTAAADAHVEAVVLLLVDQRVAGRRRAQHVGLHVPGEQGVGVVFDVQQGPVVVGPDQVAGSPADRVGQGFAAVQVDEADRVLAPAIEILGPGQQPVVLADRKAADLVEVLALGQRVDVQQHLLAAEITGFVGALDRQRIDPIGVGAAGMDGIVLAGLETAVVPPATLAVRHRAVVLLDPRDDLLVQPVLHALQRRQHRIGIGVLGLQVGQHLRVLALVVAQPVVLVAALGAVRGGDRVRPLRRVRRRGRGGQGARFGAGGGSGGTSGFAAGWRAGGQGGHQQGSRQQEDVRIQLHVTGSACPTGSCRPVPTCARPGHCWPHRRGHPRCSRSSPRPCRPRSSGPPSCARGRGGRGHRGWMW